VVVASHVALGYTVRKESLVNL